MHRYFHVIQKHLFSTIKESMFTLLMTKCQSNAINNTRETLTQYNAQYEAFLRCILNPH